MVVMFSAACGDDDSEPDQGPDASVEGGGMDAGMTGEPPMVGDGDDGADMCGPTSEPSCQDFCNQVRDCVVNSSIGSLVGTVMSPAFRCT